MKSQYIIRLWSARSPLSRQLPCGGVKLLRYKVSTIILLILLSGFSDRHLFAQTVSDSLRVATYNTFLRSTLMYCLQSPENLPDCLVHYEKVPEENATQMALELLELDVDVIALNEVFDEDARAILSKMLFTKFPHQVRKLDSLYAWEDSGLMLFSRFPFEPLPYEGFLLEKPFLDATTDDVAFIQFFATDGFDKYAAKGAGLVRVKNPSSQEVYTIVFSHMQADYDSETYPDIRKRQFADVEGLITKTLMTDDLTMEHVFLMGDFNVRGEGGLVNNTVHNGLSNIPTPEWIDIFGTGFFFDEMVDAWASETSPDDRGVTHPIDSQRLDYIVVGRGVLDEAFCMQHLTRELKQTSDHMLVTADYNRDGFHCDPRNAWVNPPHDVMLDYQLDPNIDHTNLAFPGSVQWFRVILNQDSTVSIGLQTGTEFDPSTGEGVVFELYDPADLSVPIMQYEKLVTDIAGILDVPSTEGKVFIVPDEFFIKVFSPNRDFSGDYSLVIHPHSCASHLEPCALEPAKPYPFSEFRSNVFLGTDDQAWFLIDMDEADSGDAQHVRLFLDGYDRDLFKLEVRSFANPMRSAGGFVETKHNHGLIQIEADTTKAPTVFLVIHRTNPSWSDAFNVGWETNLTVLHGRKFAPGISADNPKEPNPLHLICLDETNPELGSDEIILRMSVDNSPFKKVLNKEYECNDGDVWRSLEDAIGVVRYIDNVRFQIIEGDITSADDQANIKTIYSLNPSVSGIHPEKWEPGWSGGLYRLTYNRSRTLNGGN